MHAHHTPLTSCLELPPGLSLAAMRAGLRESYTVRSGKLVRQAITVYDTFEWSLWFADRVLYRRDDTMVLATRQDEWIGQSLAACAVVDTGSRFCREWPPGPFRDALTPLAGLRATLPVTEIGTTERTLELLNADGKIIVRLCLASYFAAGQPHTPFMRTCRPLPLRGYHLEAGHAMDCLYALGLSNATQGPLACLLTRQGLPPRPYTLRPVFELSTEDPAREAVRQIVCRMLELARCQEPGMIDDVDSEFLHDYRICLRKIRSVVKLLKGVYPEADASRLADRCGDLSRLTNRLRDLDVYLLDRELYAGLLPDALRGGLQSLFDQFQVERAREFRRVRRHLRSAAYHRTIEDLERFFLEPDRLPPSANSAQPIRALASQRIDRRYRRIRREGKFVTEDTPDEVMHDLRIQCKKLRYLLEFFCELYDTREVGRLLNHLRRLQNRLGRFNDYAVQQVSLLSFWKALEASASPETSLAVGGLVAALNRRQDVERTRARKALQKFCATDVRDDFRRLFSEAEDSP